MNNLYKAKVTIPSISFSYGWINIEADNKEEAKKRLESLTNEEIYEKVDWFDSDSSEDDIKSIDIEFDTLTEI